MSQSMNSMSSVCPREHGLKPRSPGSLHCVSDAPRVRVSFPGRPEYLRLARMASSDAASRAGFDIEEIDDLRIAVSELCHLLSGDGASHTVTLEFTIRPAEVLVEGSSDATAPIAADDLALAIVAAVADEHELRNDGGRRTFRLVKRASAR